MPTTTPTRSKNVCTKTDCSDSASLGSGVGATDQLSSPRWREAHCITFCEVLNNLKQNQGPVVDCSGCRAVLNDRLSYGEEEYFTNRLLQATFEWHTCGDHGDESGCLQLRPSYVTSSRTGNMLSRFPIGDWVKRSQSIRWRQETNRCHFHRRHMDDGHQWPLYWKSLHAELKQRVLKVPVDAMRHALGLHCHQLRLCKTCADRVWHALDCVVRRDTDPDSMALARKLGLQKPTARETDETPDAILFDQNRFAIVVQRSQLMRSFDDGEDDDGAEESECHLLNICDELTIVFGRVLQARIEQEWYGTEAHDYISGLIFRLALDTVRLKVQKAEYLQRYKEAEKLLCNAEFCSCDDDSSIGQDVESAGGAGSPSPPKTRKKSRKKSKKKRKKNNKSKKKKNDNCPEAHATQERQVGVTHACSCASATDTDETGSEHDVHAQARMLGISVAEFQSLKAEMTAAKPTIRANRIKRQVEWEERCECSTCATCLSVAESKEHI